MKHFLRPIGHCLTTAVVTSAVLEAYSLPALPTTNSDRSNAATAVSNDSDNQAVSLPAQSEPAPSPVPIASPAPAPAPAVAPDAPQPEPTASSQPETAPAVSAASLAAPAPITPAIQSAPEGKLEPKTEANEPASIDNVVNLDALPSADLAPLAAPGLNLPASPPPAAPETSVPSSPAAATPSSEIANSNAEDLAAAKQVLEAELSALVERDRPAREAQFQQNLVVSALLYAQLGEFDLARRTAQHPSLPPEVQADTLAKIDQLEAKQQNQLPQATPEVQTAQTPPLTVNPAQPIAIPQQWRASRIPTVVRPGLSNQCLPRVTVNQQAPNQGAIAQSPKQEAIEISKTFAALVANSQLTASSVNLAQPVSLTTAPLPADFPAAPGSDPLNLAAETPTAEGTADFKLEKAVESTLNKSLDKVGILAPATMPIAVKSALNWWTLLATGDVVVEALGEIPDTAAIAPATQAEPIQAETAATTEPKLADDALFTVLEQHLPKLSGKVGETPEAKPVAQQPSQAAANCAGTQPIFYNPAFSVNTAALNNLQWGRIAFPLPIPAAITSAFGWRIHPITGDRRFHAGIDIGAPTGTPVVAALSGRVVAADYMGGYGLAVIIENAETAQRNLYAHLSGIAVQPGMTLNQGNVLGWVGSTGNSTGPHLHFETQVLTTEGWVAIDPIGVASGAGVAVSQGK
jgi:murein DD-endopeptidase MepM/ murein hydrolase activator NlpD